MKRVRADRSMRILLKSSVIRDRVFMRRTRAETAEFFDRLCLSDGEIALLQTYDPKKGWDLMRARGAA